MIALLVAACAVGPNYRRPKVAAPAAFRFQRHPGPDRSLADLPWWKIFRDDALQQLVREALANNQDLRIAISRIEQARAVQLQVRANFFPQLGYQTQATRLGGPQQLSIAGLGVPAGQRTMDRARHPMPSPSPAAPRGSWTLGANSASERIRSPR